MPLQTIDGGVVGRERAGQEAEGAFGIERKLALGVFDPAHRIAAGGQIEGVGEGVHVEPAAARIGARDGRGAGRIARRNLEGRGSSRGGERENQEGGEAGGRAHGKTWTVAVTPISSAEAAAAERGAEAGAHRPVTRASGRTRADADAND